MPVNIVEKDSTAAPKFHNMKEYIQVGIDLNSRPHIPEVKLI